MKSPHSIFFWSDVFGEDAIFYSDFGTLRSHTYNHQIAITFILLFHHFQMYITYIHMLKHTLTKARISSTRMMSPRTTIMQTITRRPRAMKSNASVTLTQRVFWPGAGGRSGRDSSLYRPCMLRTDSFTHSGQLSSMVCMFCIVLCISVCVRREHFVVCMRN